MYIVSSFALAEVQDLTPANPVAEIFKKLDFIKG
jgi:hypothetical protein